MKFESLVTAFSVPFQLILPADPNGGAYVDGEWVPNKSDPVTKEGAIIPYTDKEIFESGGRISEHDRQLAYVGDLPLNAEIIDGSNTYKILSVGPYRDHYADTNLYQLKAVSVFGQQL